MALIAIVALVATACTSEVSGQATVGDAPPRAATDTTGPAPSEPASSDPAADGAVRLVDTVEWPSDTSGIQLQDIWMFAGMRGMAEDGTSEHILAQIVDALAPRAGEPVPLTDSLAFAPIPDVNAMFASGLGEVRHDVVVTLGLFSVRTALDGTAVGDATLGVLSSAPDGATNVSGGDELVLDTGQIPGLDRYPSVVVDYVFGQAEPAADATYGGSDPVDVLAARFAAGSVTWTGMEVEGQMETALRRGVVGQLESPAALAVREAANGMRSPGTAFAPAAGHRAHPGGTAQPGGVVEHPGQQPAGPAQQHPAQQPAAQHPAQQPAAQHPAQLPAQHPADPGTILGGLLGIPIKEGVIGWPTVAFTAFCIAGGLLLPPPANVVFAVFCVALDVVSTVGSIGDAIKDNNGGNGGRSGASSSGDPHLTTFDGARRSMMAVGEFDMVIADGMRVQIRTAPWGTHQHISINTAAAFDVNGDTVVIDALAEESADDPPGALLVTVNGDRHTVGQAQRLELPGDGTVMRIGDALLVSWPDESSSLVTLRHASLDIQVSLGDENTTVTGLFGDSDGNPDNDYFARDGQLPDPLTDEAFYGVVVDSWRVDEASTLFGEELTHDPSFPAPGDPLAEVDPAVLTWAEMICRAAGLVEIDFDECVLDVAATGDAAFSQRAAANQAMVNPGAFDFESDRSATLPRQRWTVIRDMSLTDSPAMLDGVGHLVVGVRGDDGAEVHALTMPGLAPGWSAELSRECGFDVGGQGIVVAPLRDGDDNVLRIGSGSTDLLDRSATTIYDDPLVLGIPGEGKPCDQIALNTSDPRAAIIGRTQGEDDPMLFWVGEQQLGSEDPAAEPVGTLDVPGLTGGPVVAADGSVWVLTAVDEQLTAARFDSAGEELVDQVRLPGAKPAGPMVATEDGFVVPVTGNDEDSVVRVDGSGVAWRAQFPMTIDDTELRLPERLSVDATTVAGYSGSDDIVVLDATSGTPQGTFRATSFNNNGGAIAHHEGDIVVGPFGGKHWLEAYDAADFGLTWAVQEPIGVKTNDVKRIDSLGGEGLVVQSTVGGDEGGILVDLITVG